MKPGPNCEGWSIDGQQTGLPALPHPLPGLGICLEPHTRSLRGAARDPEKWSGEVTSLRLREAVISGVTQLDWHPNVQILSKGVPP